MFGTGLIKGLAATAKTFVSTFTDPTKLVTIEYPDERQSLAENTRQFPFLVYDGEDSMKGLRCVACQICEKECPPQCIYIVKSKDKKPDHKGQMQFYPAVFDIDISVCMSCQICVEVCPFEAIKMDTEFELSRGDRFRGLLFDKQELAKSNEHYRHLHPEDAAESDASLAADKAKAEAKARADAEAKAKAAAAKAPPVPATSPEAPNPPTASSTGAPEATSAPSPKPPFAAMPM